MALTSITSQFNWPPPAKRGIASRRYEMKLSFRDNLEVGPVHVRVYEVAPGPPEGLAIQIFDEDEMISEDDILAGDPEKLVATAQGTILERPSTFFSENAEAVSSELEDLSNLFCEPDGTASRISHPHLKEGSEAVEKGGFFHIDTVEVKPSHSCQLLGLRVLDEVLLQLREHWTLAAMYPLSLNCHWLRWKSNARVGDFLIEAEEKIEKRLLEVKVQRHFLRMGFQQGGRCKALARVSFLTAERYFAGDRLKKWLTKEQAEAVDLFVEPLRHLPTGLDEELASYLRYEQSSAITDTPEELLADSIGPYEFARYMQGLNPEATKMMRVLERKCALQRQAFFDRIRKLISQGASIHGSRALFIAVGFAWWKDKRPLLNFLVQAGADVNQPDEDGNTPIIIAAKRKCCSAAVVLRDLGANPAAKNLEGETALQMFQSHEDEEQTTWEILNQRPVQKGQVLEYYQFVHALMPVEQRLHLTEDWMSPRMLHTIKKAAQDHVEALKLQPHRDMWMHNSTLSHVPKDDIEAVPAACEKQFLKAWLQIWKAILYVLEKGLPPTVNRIRDCLEAKQIDQVDWEAHVVFVSNNGRLEYALGALSGTASQYEYTCVGSGLPITALDQSWDLIRHMCVVAGGGDHRCFPTKPVEFSQLVDPILAPLYL